MIEANWNDDGHIISLELNQHEVVVTTVNCPGGACRHEDAACVVRYFIEIYGLECNVGVCPVAAEMPIAWTLIGNARDLDACQLWFIPTDDQVFQSWISPYRPEP